MDFAMIIGALVVYLVIMFLLNRMFEKIFKFLLVIVTVLFIVAMLYFFIK